MYYFSQDPP
jgi:hypothetical protein